MEEDEDDYILVNCACCLPICVHWSDFYDLPSQDLLLIRTNVSTPTHLFKHKPCSLQTQPPLALQPLTLKRPTSVINGLHSGKRGAALRPLHALNNTQPRRMPLWQKQFTFNKCRDNETVKAVQQYGNVWSGHTVAFFRRPTLEMAGIPSLHTSYAVS